MAVFLGLRCHEVRDQRDNGHFSTGQEVTKGKYFFLSRVCVH